ncbi:MAG: 50S ribosomal protein L4, partial [Azonexus sp.]
GGGRIFPNSPEENFSQKVNKKMFRAGMAAILSELARQDRLIVVDGLSIDAPKTKLFAQKLKGMGLDGNLLVITDALDENLYLSSRNLPNVLVLEAQEADPVSLVRFAKVLVTKNAVAKFEEMWG